MFAPLFVAVGVALLSSAFQTAAQFDHRVTTTTTSHTATTTTATQPRARVLEDEDTAPSAAAKEKKGFTDSSGGAGGGSGGAGGDKASSPTPNVPAQKITSPSTSPSSSERRGGAIEALLGVRESRVLPRELRARVRVASSELTAAGLGPLAAAAVDAYGGGERVRIRDKRKREGAVAGLFLGYLLEVFLIFTKKKVLVMSQRYRAHKF